MKSSNASTSECIEGIPQAVRVRTSRCRAAQRSSQCYRSERAQIASVVQGTAAPHQPSEEIHFHDNVRMERSTCCKASVLGHKVLKHWGHCLTSRMRCRTSATMLDAAPLCSPANMLSEVMIGLWLNVKSANMDLYSLVNSLSWLVSISRSGRGSWAALRDMSLICSVCGCRTSIVTQAPFALPETPSSPNKSLQAHCCKPCPRVLDEAEANRLAICLYNTANLVCGN